MAPKNNWRIAAFIPIAAGILFSLYAFFTGYLPDAEYFALYMIIGNIFIMFFAAIFIAMAEPEK